MRALFENKRVARAAKLFRPFSNMLLVLFPNFNVELKQAEYKINSAAYASIAMYLTSVYSLLLFVLLMVFLYVINILEPANIILMAGISALFFTFTFFNLMKTPKLYLLRKGKEIDASLLFALRHMYIKIKSGIPFFDSIVGIAYGDYGAVSREFKKLVRDVEGGENELVSLERLGFFNPSSFFRRFVWQMTNSIRAGTDVSKTLEIIVKGLENERYLQVKEFGSRLSPIALMYIMFTIILPAIGTTFLAVFSSFFGGAIPDQVFFAVPVIILFSNLLFMNIIRATRPVFEMS